MFPLAEVLLPAELEVEEEVNVEAVDVVGPLEVADGVAEVLKPVDEVGTDDAVEVEVADEDRVEVEADEVSKVLEVADEEVEAVVDVDGRVVVDVDGRVVVVDTVTVGTEVVDKEVDKVMVE